MTYILFTREKLPAGTGSTVSDAIKDSLQWMDSDEHTENSIIEAIGTIELARQFDAYEFFLFKTEISLDLVREMEPNQMENLLYESIESGEFRDVRSSEIPDAVYENTSGITAEKILSFLNINLNIDYSNDSSFIVSNLPGMNDAIDYVACNIDEDTDYTELESFYDCVCKILIDEGYAQDCCHSVVDNSNLVQLTEKGRKKLSGIYC